MKLSIVSYQKHVKLSYPKLGFIKKEDLYVVKNTNMEGVCCGSRMPWFAKFMLTQNAQS